MGKKLVICALMVVGLLAAAVLVANVLFYDGCRALCEGDDWCYEQCIQLTPQPGTPVVVGE